MKFEPRSNRSCSLSVLLSSPSCRMGTLEASYLMMLGGVVPGGKMRSSVCAMDVTCESATSTLALGWKYRSEEHTSELQSLRHLVCRLLLGKKTRARHNQPGEDNFQLRPPRHTERRTY